MSRRCFLAPSEWDAKCVNQYISLGPFLLMHSYTSRNGSHKRDCFTYFISLWNGKTRRFIFSPLTLLDLVPFPCRKLWTNYSSATSKMTKHKVIAFPPVSIKRPIPAKVLPNFWAERDHSLKYQKSSGSVVAASWFLGWGGQLLWREALLGACLLVTCVFLFQSVMMLCGWWQNCSKCLL